MFCFNRLAPKHFLSLGRLFNQEEQDELPSSVNGALIPCLVVLFVFMLAAVPDKRINERTNFAI